MEYFAAEKPKVVSQLEWTPTICNCMDRTGEHYAKWNKPGGERQIPYDLIYK